MLIIFASLTSCSLIWNSLLFPDQCSCKVIGGAYVTDTLGNTVWKDDVVHWSDSVIKKDKVEELKRKCKEQAKQYQSSSCECD